MSWAKIPAFRVPLRVVASGRVYRGRVDTALTGPLPTPAIAHLTKTIRASAGVVISASHNPYYDNGIKFFQGKGHKFDDALEQEIEKQFHQPMRTASDLGKATRIPDAAGRYIEFCKSAFPQTQSLSECCLFGRLR
ncbi:MAG: hypothetical protein CM1200mP41_25050 [Gammaproteobacteria bacterium]|nr:MAG: hypothetical protein CM1200mP41_25050 [Gammaproteobacteria bacterium]